MMMELDEGKGGVELISSLICKRSDDNNGLEVFIIQQLRPSFIVVF